MKILCRLHYIIILYSNKETMVLPNNYLSLLTLLFETVWRDLIKMDEKQLILESQLVTGYYCNFEGL